MTGRERFRRSVRGVATALLAMAVLSCGGPRADVDVGERIAPRPSALTKIRRAFGIESGRVPSRAVELPVGTVLHLQLEGRVTSESRVGDPAEAVLTRAVEVNGQSVLPAGTIVRGTVSAAGESHRVEGRAHLELSFTHLALGGVNYAITTSGYSRTAVRVDDAASFGARAASGAGLLARGEDVSLQSGTDVTVHLVAPLRVRVAN